MSTEVTVELIGSIAGALVVLSFFPQIFKIFKEKGSDISISFIFLQILCNILYVIYGSLIYKFPIFITNSIILLELFIILFSTLFYSYKNRKEAKLLEKNKLASKMYDVYI